MLIADENIDSRIVEALRKTGIEVFSVFEDLRGVKDNEIIELAQKTGYIILTEDKDFGEWVFAHKIDNVSVVFLRYQFSETDEMIQTLTKMFEKDLEKFIGFFTTLTTKKIRQRRV